MISNTSGSEGIEREGRDELGEDSEDIHSLSSRVAFTLVSMVLETRKKGIYIIHTVYGGVEAKDMDHIWIIS